MVWDSGPSTQTPSATVPSSPVCARTAVPRSYASLAVFTPKYAARWEVGASESVMTTVTPFSTAAAMGSSHTVESPAMMTMASQPAATRDSNMEICWVLSLSAGPV